MGIDVHSVASLEDNIIESLARVKVFDMSHNKLSSELSFDLAAFSQAEQFHLDHNQLYGPIRDFFSFFSCVRARAGGDCRSKASRTHEPGARALPSACCLPLLRMAYSNPCGTLPVVNTAGARRTSR